MASDVQQTYYEWKHEEEDSQEPSISQIIDHGSISFGRFAFESLSWEKRSVFTHNERQEELEKFKSPGSVAKKKAYFEEYYKKIRALKAMQNQQTELSLEYGANGSISSQTGDEDETPLPSTCSIEMPESISETPSEDHTAEITFEKKCGEVVEHECVAPEFVEDSAAKESIEEPHESRCEIKEENYIFDSEYSVSRLSTGSSEEINRNENSRAKWRYDNDAYLKMEPDLTPSIECSTDPTVSNSVEVDFVPVDDLVLEKNKLIVHKPNEGPTSVVMLKEQATSVRYLSKSVNKSLPAKSQSSMASKQLHKSIDKAHVDISSSKTTSNKARSCKKPSFVACHRPPTEVQNKVTFSRAGPISKERKGAVPTNASEHVLRSQSKASNGRNLNPKGKFRAQGDLKEMEKATQNSIKNRALQSKSVGHGKFKMNLDNRGDTVEGRAATEQLKTRSINLPSRSSHGPNGDISYQSACLSVGDKTKKANASTVRKYEVKDSKISTLRQSGNIKVDTIKKHMTTVEIEKHGRLNGVRQSFIDGKKSRKEKPRWR